MGQQPGGRGRLMQPPASQAASARIAAQAGGVPTQRKRRAIQRRRSSKQPPTNILMASGAQPGGGSCLAPRKAGRGMRQGMRACGWYACCGSAYASAGAGAASGAAAAWGSGAAAGAAARAGAASCGGAAAGAGGAAAGAGGAAAAPGTGDIMPPKSCVEDCWESTSGSSAPSASAGRIVLCVAWRRPTAPWSLRRGRRRWPIRPLQRVQQPSQAARRWPAPRDRVRAAAAASAAAGAPALPGPLIARAASSEQRQERSPLVLPRFLTAAAGDDGRAAAPQAPRLALRGLRAACLGRSSWTESEQRGRRHDPSSVCVARAAVRRAFLF
jgi:hypothetical protein